MIEHDHMTTHFQIRPDHPDQNEKLFHFGQDDQV